MRFLFDGRLIMISLVASWVIMIGIDHYLLPAGEHVWPVPAGLVLAGAFCLITGLIARRHPKVLVLEVRTGRERWEQPAGSMWWIRTEYWGVLYLGAGVAFSLLMLFVHFHPR